MRVASDGAIAASSKGPTFAKGRQIWATRGLRTWASSQIWATGHVATCRDPLKSLLLLPEEVAAFLKRETNRVHPLWLRRNIP